MRSAAPLNSTKSQFRSTRILIVEDDMVMQEELHGTFGTLSDFEVMVADNGQDALATLARYSPTEKAILILDLGLPDMDGIEILGKAISTYRHIAIIVITARQDIESKLAALERGADAYLGKPFDQRELMATVFAVCRRVFPGTSDMVTPYWQLNIRDWMLVAPNNVQIKLTIPETQLIDLLHRHEGKPVSRLKISESLGNIYRFSGNALEAMISRLRRKISQAYPGVNLIRAVNGTGYILNAKIR